MNASGPGSDGPAAPSLHPGPLPPLLIYRITPPSGFRHHRGQILHVSILYDLLNAGSAKGWEESQEIKALEFREVQKRRVSTAWSAFPHPTPDPQDCRASHMPHTTHFPGRLPRQTGVPETAFPASFGKRTLHFLQVHHCSRPTRSPPQLPAGALPLPTTHRPYTRVWHVPYSTSAEALTLQHLPSVWLMGNPEKPIKSNGLLGDPGVGALEAPEKERKGSTGNTLRAVGPWDHVGGDACICYKS